MLNVLVLDNDHLSNVILMTHLESVGMPCSFLAQTAADALKLLTSGFRVDLVIASWETPGLQSFIDSIKYLGSEALVALSMGPDHREDEGCAEVCCKPYDFGAVSVMLKPYRRLEVTRKLKALQRQLLQKNRAKEEIPQNLFMPAALQGRLA